VALPDKLLKLPLRGGNLPLLCMRVRNVQIPTGFRKAEFLAGCRARGQPYSQDLEEKYVSAFVKSDSLLATFPLPVQPLSRD